MPRCWPDFGGGAVVNVGGGVQAQAAVPEFVVVPREKELTVLPGGFDRGELAGEVAFVGRGPGTPLRAADRSAAGTTPGPRRPDPGGRQTRTSRWADGRRITPRLRRSHDTAGSALAAHPATMRHTGVQAATAVAELSRGIGAVKHYLPGRDR